MIGSRGCGQKVQDKVEEKQERGEELTATEQQMLEADDPDAVNAVGPQIPIVNVPISGPVVRSVPTCWLCTGAGLVGSLVVTVFVYQ